LAGLSEMRRSHAVAAWYAKCSDFGRIPLTVSPAPLQIDREGILEASFFHQIRQLGSSKNMVEDLFFPSPGVNSTNPPRNPFHGLP